MVAPSRASSSNTGRGRTILTFLLTANLIVCLGILLRSYDNGTALLLGSSSSSANCNTNNNVGGSLLMVDGGDDNSVVAAEAPAAADTTTTTTTSSIPDFLSVASQTRTDKVRGTINMPGCNDPVADKCGEGERDSCCKYTATEPTCRVFGHFYDTLYQRYLGPLTVSNEPFQFLEIGYSLGFGFDTYHRFFSQNAGDNNMMAELHSMEINCDAFARNPNVYPIYKDKNRLHCGDASNYDFLQSVWTTHMKRPDAPPLKVVIDDASHLSKHIVASVFFWFPKLEPGGYLVIEDIQPINLADQFRTEFLPQAMRDLTFCGYGFVSTDPPNGACFPTLQPLLARIDCEMHICVFVRNDKAAMLNMDKESYLPPPNALDSSQCFQRK